MNKEGYDAIRRIIDTSFDGAINVYDNSLLPSKVLEKKISLQKDLLIKFDHLIQELNEKRVFLTDDLIWSLEKKEEIEKADHGHENTIS